jgi:hypothetical protein
MNMAKRITIAANIQDCDQEVAKEKKPKKGKKKSLLQDCEEK